MEQAREERIREIAHRLWEAEGRPKDRERQHWAEAERQLMLDEGLGEPSDTPPDLAALPEDERPEPQPKTPADPL